MVKNVTTKINEANQEIKELLSLSYEQFKQIVMLLKANLKKCWNPIVQIKKRFFRNIFQQIRLRLFNQV